MKRIVDPAFRLIRSKTARSLYWVFSGNGLSIGLAVVVTILISRNGPSELGLFLALFSFASLIADLSEIGLSTSLSSFIPPLVIAGQHQQVKKVLSTAFFIQLMIGLAIAAIVILLSPLLARVLFDHTESLNVTIAALIIIALLFFNFATFALSAFKKFQESALISICTGLVRLTLLIILTWFKMLTLTNILLVQLTALVVGFVYGLIFLRPAFLMHKPDLHEAKKLLRFSSALGLQKVFVAISSRLDILMLTALVNSSAAGIYGAAMRFAQIYPYAISSFAQVLAPTFAGFGRIKESLAFLRRSLLIMVLFLFSMVILFIFADPIIRIPFKNQFVESIAVFRWLLVAMIGFILAVPFYSFVIYTLRKPFVIATASFLQLVAIFLANLYFIPRHQELGPVVGVGIGNTIVFGVAFAATLYYSKRS
ncbi:hypothetical protein C4564_00835 [Candidatus Microgenomates bacterium]|nr:MAG: hypothetical protein C4564_00835 [Candidatus Microgenomates bacterium]